MISHCHQRSQRSRRTGGRREEREGEDARAGLKRGRRDHDERYIGASASNAEPTSKGSPRLHRRRQARASSLTKCPASMPPMTISTMATGLAAFRRSGRRDKLNRWMPTRSSAPIAARAKRVISALGRASACQVLLLSFRDFALLHLI